MNENEEDKGWWCSAGLNRICVYPNGNISRCFSRPSFTNIWDFNSEKDLHVWECNTLRCNNCDKCYVTIDKNLNVVEKNHHIQRKKFNIPEQLIVELLTTDVCPYFCPYCIRSDRAIYRKNNLVEVEIKDFVFFLNKIPESFVLISGGEPTLRDDLGHILATKINHDLIIMSSCLYKKGIENIISLSKIYQKKIQFLPSLHVEARGFDWNRFWENIELIINNIYTQVFLVKIIDYKIENIIDKFIDKCNNLKLKYMISSVDYTISNPDRIDWNYAKHHDPQNNFKNFKHPLLWNSIDSDNIFGYKEKISVNNTNE